MKKLFLKNFVGVKVYCHSVVEEHDPRGPEGPYQFQYKSVPAMLVKDCKGKTLSDQFGCPSQDAAVMAIIRRLIKTSVQTNGPIVPPSNLVAVQRVLDKMNTEMEALKYDKVWRWYLELDEVTKEFADYPEDKVPAVVASARAVQEQYRVLGDEATAEAKVLEEGGFLVETDDLLRDTMRTFKILDDVVAQARTARILLYSMEVPREVTEPVSNARQHLLDGKFKLAYQLANTVAIDEESSEQDIVDAVYLKTLLEDRAQVWMTATEALVQVDPFDAVNRMARLGMIYISIPSFKEFYGNTNSWKDLEQYSVLKTIHREFFGVKRSIRKARKRRKLSEEKPKYLASLQALLLQTEGKPVQFLIQKELDALRAGKR